MSVWITPSLNALRRKAAPFSGATPDAIPRDEKTWTRPVIRLGYYGQEPFRKAVNTPLLHAAFDQLVGNGRWHPRADLGSFPVRFPHADDPGDTGWHVDLSFPGTSDDPNERE